ncbi:MAG: Maf family protein [Paludibacteraceae bacterium]
MKILLGSQSPRRRELLTGMDVDFWVVAIDADEHYPEGLTGGDIPYYISRAKAEAYGEPLAEDEVLLTADTIVWVPGEGESMGAVGGAHLHEDDNRRRDAHDKSVCTTCVPSGVMLGKPRDEEEARTMLRLLSGRMHEVYTGVTLKTREGMQTIVDKTEVWFRALAEEEIDYYVERYRPLDKAGAYGVQEWIGYVGVTKIVGSYFNVMGLPVERVWEEMKREKGRSPDVKKHEG